MAAEAPSAIRLSMLGLRCPNVLNPTAKNFRFMYTMGISSRNWVRANVRAFSFPWK